MDLAMNIFLLTYAHEQGIQKETGGIRKVRELGEVDLFIHDSLHTYEVMRAEYELAWPHLDRGRVLASDDVNFNKAFLEFSHEVGATPMVWRARLGMIVKR